MYVIKSLFAIVTRILMVLFRLTSFTRHQRGTTQFETCVHTHVFTHTDVKSFSPSEIKEIHYDGNCVPR